MDLNFDTFQQYLSWDKSCQHLIKKYKAAFAFIYHGGILCWSTQMSYFDLHQFYLFNKQASKLGIAEWKFLHK